MFFMFLLLSPTPIGKHFLVPREAPQCQPGAMVFALAAPTQSRLIYIYKYNYNYDYNYDNVASVNIILSSEAQINMFIGFFEPSKMLRLYFLKNANVQNFKN